MSIIDNALEDIFDIDRSAPAPRPLRIPEAVPALEEVRPPVVIPTPNEIIRRAYGPDFQGVERPLRETN